MIHPSQKFKGMTFPVLLEKDEDGFVISCPLFDGCFTQGDTREEAIKNIKEVIEMCLEEEENRELAEKYVNNEIKLDTVSI